jgi:Holliday junction resolvasome RuvABC endonuclease subunit
VDQSLTSTGYAYRRDGVVVTGRIDGSEVRGSHRLAFVRNQLQSLLQEVQPSLVVFEGYALGGFRKGKSMLADLGELGGVLKLHVWEAGFPALVVGPTLLKSIIADKGNAKKPEIREAIKKKFNLDIRQDDEADAFGLLVAGEARMGHVHAMLSSTRLEKLFDTPVIAGQRRLSSSLKSTSPEQSTAIAFRPRRR